MLNERAHLKTDRRQEGPQADCVTDAMDECRVSLLLAFTHCLL